MNHTAELALRWGLTFLLTLTIARELTDDAWATWLKACIALLGIVSVLGLLACILTFVWSCC